MDDYIFTKRHVLDALNRARNEGHMRREFGAITELEERGFQTALIAMAKEMGVDREYVNSVPAVTGA